MSKPVWIILLITFLMLGLFDASNYFNSNDNPGRDVGTPQFFEFWGFVIVIVVGSLVIWYRKRKR